MAEQTDNYGLTLPTEDDFYNIEDFNNNMEKIDTEIKNAQDKADQAFQSASNGKAAIKAAITGIDPEVTIPTNATFAQLAAAIGQIETGVDTEDATATAEFILAGLTAYIKGVKVTGTMSNRGTVNITPGTANQAIPKGYHNGNGVVAGDPDLVTGNIKAGVNIFGVNGKSSVVDTADAVAGEGVILTGYNAYVNGAKVNGTMPYVNPDYSDQRGALGINVGPYSGDGANYAYMNHGLSGKYSNGVNVVRSYEPYLRPEYIVSPASIMGVIGAAVMGKKFATGTVTSTAVNIPFVNGSGGGMNMNSITVTGITFHPSFIFCKYAGTNVIYYIFYLGGGFGASTYPGWCILFGSAGPNVNSDKYQYGGQLGLNGFVNSTGFCLPTDRNSLPYTWYAWE